MDLTVIILASAAGALIGTSVGVLLMGRKLRPLITDKELAELKSRLHAGESSLAAASANLEQLRKQIAMHEEALLQRGEELKQKQEQLDISLTETQKEKARSSAAEQYVQQLGVKTVQLTEQCKKLEAHVREQNSVAAEEAEQFLATQAELEAAKRQIRELIEQTAHLTSESVEFKRVAEQEVRFRTALEVQLNTDQEQIRQMTGQIADLQQERLRLENQTTGRESFERQRGWNCLW